MTPKKLYELLDKAKVEFKIVESFEGLRTLSFVVDEDDKEHHPDCPAVDGFGCCCDELGEQQ
jgi:hypothetical protein